MPDQEILAYYDAVAPKMLPFLRGRPLAVRSHFGKTVVFRRHPAFPQRRRKSSDTARSMTDKHAWIRVQTKNDLLALVRQHGYEFFPHLEGDRDLWFALDIDVRDIPLYLGVRAVQAATDVLHERQVKFLLSFSGGNGFHIRWSFPLTDLPSNKWAFLRRIVRSLRDECEQRLQQSPGRAVFSKYIPKGDPITECSSADKAAQHSILFDELILRKLATIRAPFSLHMKHRWVAVPLSPQCLSDFDPAQDATPAVARTLPVARLPRNPVAPFLRSPWIS